MKRNTLLLLVFCLFYHLAWAQNATIFADNFETPQTWTIFEEIVSSDTCYAKDLGEVTRSTDIAQVGTNALRVWSNKNRSKKSNHVIAAHHISNTEGITGRLIYGMWVYNATNIGLTQSSPEFSVQSTRAVDGINKTFIAGIQYIGNQWVADKWNIWHNGTWKTIKATEFNTTLVANTWYYLELEFDMTQNTYINFKIQGGGINQTLDLTQNFANIGLGCKIGGETRGWTPSFFVTAESENLWSGCSQIHEDKVYYDNVLLQSVVVLPLELLDFKGVSEGKINRLKWLFAHSTSARFETSPTLEELTVEKSKDGLNFIPLSWNIPIPSGINGKNIITSSRFETSTTLDDSPFDITYYRLKMIELDGKTNYSKIIAVNLTNTEGYQKPLKVYPNPATDVLTIENTEGQDITIVNVLGQVVMQSSLPINHLSLSINHLKSGVYFIKVKDNTVRFVKN